MSVLRRLPALFPACVLALAADAALGLLRAPGLGAAAWLLFVLYGLPVAAYRLHQRRFPLEQGVSYLDGPAYCPWWGGQQLQAVYIAFPALEAGLRLVPGLYSAWLRLWGSRIGAGVYWTPRCAIVDRGLLELGDHVLFGHEVQCFAHVVKPRNGRLILYVRRVAIGSGAFIGAGSRLGPGVVIEPGCKVPLLSDLRPNRRFAEPAHDPKTA